MMERQLTQMVRLVDDLLDVSRITTGKLSLRKRAGAILRRSCCAAVDTDRAVRRCAPACAAGVAPARAGDASSADPTRLAQVFSNLLHNAAKFTPPGGRIDADRGTGARPEVVVRALIDNGIGIAPDMLGGVFEMFAQADQSLERPQAGLGVGLTLARRLVELHGGTLAAESEGVGRGSQFIVRLPTASAGAATAPPAARVVSPAETTGHRGARGRRQPGLRQQPRRDPALDGQRRSGRARRRGGARCSCRIGSRRSASSTSDCPSSTATILRARLRARRADGRDDARRGHGLGPGKRSTACIRRRVRPASRQAGRADTGDRDPGRAARDSPMRARVLIVTTS